MEYQQTLEVGNSMIVLTDTKFSHGHTNSYIDVL